MHKGWEALGRMLLERKLALLTDGQRHLFHKLYPGGVKVDKLSWALTQCDNTIAKNRLGRRIGSSLEDL